MQTKTIALSGNACIDCYLPDPAIGFHEDRPRPALVICPGGAYLIHATKEGEAVALEFCARGFAAFVLKYTVGLDREHPENGFNRAARYPMQALELMEAIHILRKQRDEFHLTDDIFLVGFSAGGHVAATVGTRWMDPELTGQLSFVPEPKELRTAGMVLGYPMLGDNPEDFQGSEFKNLDRGAVLQMNHVLYGADAPSDDQRSTVDLVRFVSKDSVPAFIWHSADDPVVDSRKTTAFILRMQEMGIDCEYHLFSCGKHGLALANKYYAHDESGYDQAISGWPNLAEYWMDRIMEGKASS
ncbi:MAG: alpha/beta hydrolase [Atopobiaceae bacterium]|jgi:endo-1,4-beta-xylanase|nr:alpha/beta hydrolase [Atopobium sp.]MCI1345122.1 alpha/beta hydrolase [Atopobiaceae bacterium]MCI1499078.1 alpha/beta hydrolase [Atopobiaceae bacterium]MCI1540735.1 alpha/beta hydrolase [Atopobiaceae bacterium]